MDNLISQLKSSLLHSMQKVSVRSNDSPKILLIQFVDLAYLQRHNACNSVLAFDE